MPKGIGCDRVFEINGSRSRSEKRRTHLTLKRPREPEWTDVEACDLPEANQNTSGDQPPSWVSGQHFYHHAH